MEEVALPGWRGSLAKIAPGDLDIAIIGELAATELALDDHLKPGALKVECLKAPMRARRAFEHPLERPLRHPYRALVCPRTTLNSTASRLAFQRASSGKLKNMMASGSEVRPSRAELKNIIGTSNLPSSADAKAE